jgi:hypothetical protein
MLITAPDAFLFDLHYTFTRLGGKPFIEQIHDLAQNYTILLSQDFWLMAGLIGLFMLPKRSATTALMLLLLPIALLGRTVALHNLSAYYMIPLLPFVTLGAASFIEQISRYIPRHLVGANRTQHALAYGLVLALTVTPLMTITWDMLNKVNSHYPTDIDSFLLDPQAAQQVSTYINQHTSDDDVVIASPGLGWMLDTNTADFQMTAAFAGFETPHFPANMPQERFAFDPRYQTARYVVIDNLWDNWGAVHTPAVAIMREEAKTWPLVFESGSIRVYENPN